MSLAKWKCFNIGNCKLVDKEIDLPVGEHEPTCEECGSTLMRIGRRPPRKLKLLVASVIGLAVVAGLVFTFREEKRGEKENPVRGVGGDRDARLPIITSTALVAVQVGQPLDHSFRVTDPAARIDVGELPPWLHFDATSKRLTGTPTAAGRTILTVSARNGAGADTQSLQISIGLAGGLTNPVPPLPPSPLVHRRVLIPIKAADTNLTLELLTDQVVFSVRVRVNSGIEQALQNRDDEAATITLNPTSTPEDLYEVITQINEGSPQVHRFPKYGERKIEVWVKGLSSCVVSAERLAIALVNEEDPSLRNDPTLNLAEKIKSWAEQYQRDLRLIPILDDAEAATKAQQRIVDRFANRNQSQLLTIMAPVVGRHLNELRTKGEIATNFVGEILQAYKSHPNPLKVPNPP